MGKMLTHILIDDYSQEYVEIYENKIEDALRDLLRNIHISDSLLKEIKRGYDI